MDKIFSAFSFNSPYPSRVEINIGVFEHRHHPILVLDRRADFILHKRFDQFRIKMLARFFLQKGDSIVV